MCIRDRFLGAGSIMHGMNESVNMREFGALRKAMPWTFITFAAGYLAIIGFPGFAGFYSKDAIIEAAFERGWVFGLAALIGAGVTAFYMTRLMMMTFMGEKRWRDDQHPHESSPTMVTALVVLGILSVIGGLVLANGIATWLNPAVGGTAHDVPLVHLTPMTLITLLVVAAGVALGWWMFRDRIPTTRTNPGVATLIGDNAFYADTINDWVAVKPTHVLAETAALVDSVGITTAVDDGGRGFAGLGSALGKLQNGLARTYGLIMVVGAVVVAAILLVVNQMA